MVLLPVFVIHILLASSRSFTFLHCDISSILDKLLPFHFCLCGPLVCLLKKSSLPCSLSYLSLSPTLCIGFLKSLFIKAYVLSDIKYISNFSTGAKQYNVAPDLVSFAYGRNFPKYPTEGLI